MKTNSHDIRNTGTTETLPPFLAGLKDRESGHSVPSGYFELLSAQISARIIERPAKSGIRNLVSLAGKTVVWAPSLTTAIAAALFIFFIPAQHTITEKSTSEWTELRMAYDESYAQEAILSEAGTLEDQLSIAVPEEVAVNTSGDNELTPEEITEYLKEQDLENELLY
jgi:hypothetical protein